ncbi:MAG TPA: c-type cytochrome [Chitinophagaceae bacterium]|jgi:hypothetical protein|nr:c-type cytochrome [Chitinophagaceae bacterium]
MKKSIVILSAAALSVCAIIVACNGKGSSETKTAITQDSLIKRGDYLVSTMGCDDCHSPKAFGPDGVHIIPEQRLSGHQANVQLGPIDTSVMSKGWVMMSMIGNAAVGPWGISYAANITSDSTGIGMWSEEQFFRAMRKGLYKGIEGNRPLMPPMPWEVYGKMTDDDLRAVFAYLKSTKPVKNPVPAWRPLDKL